MLKGQTGHGVGEEDTQSVSGTQTLVRGHGKAGADNSSRIYSLEL